MWTIICDRVTLDVSNSRKPCTYASHLSTCKLNYMLMDTAYDQDVSKFARLVDSSMKEVTLNCFHSKTVTKVCQQITFFQHPETHSHKWVC